MTGRKRHRTREREAPRRLGHSPRRPRAIARAATQRIKLQILHLNFLAFLLKSPAITHSRQWVLVWTHTKFSTSDRKRLHIAAF
jgi:hypothetical protein